MRRVLRSGRRQDGSVAVEFAVVLPFLLILIGGIVFYGFSLYQWVMLHAAARAGAEYARAHLYDAGNNIDPEITTAVNQAIPYCWNGTTSTCSGLTVSVTAHDQCADGKPPTSGVCSVTFGTVTDPRIFVYAKIVVTDDTWGASFVPFLPATITGWAVARYQ